MMRRPVISIVLFTLLAAAVAALCTGCDLVRASLGKPTSADLELLRLAERVRAESAAKDSTASRTVAPAPVETVASDTPADMAEPAAAPVPDPRSAVVTPETAAAVAANGIKKYYVVVGAFKEEKGINYYVKDLGEKGFNTVLIPFKSGTTAVCLEGTDDIETARAQMKTLRAYGIDAWLYASKQKLHKEQ